MPSLITHYLLAKRVKNEIKENLNDNAFFWGAQGPDFILTHNFWNKKNIRSIKKCGMYLQDMDFNELVDLLSFYIKNKNNSLLAKSYVKGLLSHYILDTNSFGFISYQSQVLHFQKAENCTLRAARNELKSSLDNIILRYEEGKLPSQVNFKKVIPKNAEVFNFMYSFYFYVLRKKFDNTIKLSEIQDALKCYRKLIALMDDKFFIKKPVVKLIEKVLKKDAYISGFIRDMIEPDYFDFANISGSKWKWPLSSKEAYTDSFIEIYENAIVKTINVLKSLDF